MKRIDGRELDEIRRVEMLPGFTKFAEGSFCRCPGPLPAQIGGILPPESPGAPARSVGRYTPRAYRSSRIVTPSGSGASSGFSCQRSGHRFFSQKVRARTSGLTW